MKISDTSAQDEVLAPKGNKSKLRVWLATLVVLTFALIWLLPAYQTWSSSDASISAQRLRLAKVIRGDFVRDISVQGKVVAAVSPRLYSTAQGRVTFNVDAGDTVVKGQILAVIDSPELANQLKQEQAGTQSLQTELERHKIQGKKHALKDQKSVDLAKVSLTAAQREKRRSDLAYQSHSISQIDFEEAQDELENAQLVYHHAVKDAQLNQESFAFEIKTKQLTINRQKILQQELARKVGQLTVRSPVSGIVGNLNVQQKNQVAKNQAILSVVDLSEFELELAIPESYADDLAIGMQAQIKLNEQQHQATLVTISPEIVNNQVKARVRFAASNRQHPKGLRQNQRLTTRILLEKKQDVLMLPRGQFLESGGGRIAYVVSQGMAKRQQISTGARSLSKVEIISGLKLGDQVIISGTDQLRNAQLINITD